MFIFEKNGGSKIVATSTIEIWPDWRGDPLVWTKDFKPVITRRVYLVFSVNLKGRRQIRVYPLQKRPDKSAPVFVVCSPNSPLVAKETTHVCFSHQNFIICRPLKAVYYSMLTALKRGEVDILGEKIITLIKHLYFTDVIDEGFLNRTEQRLSRYDKLLSRALSTEFEGERQVCLEKAWSVLVSLEKEVSNIVQSVL